VDVRQFVAIRTEEPEAVWPNPQNTRHARQEMQAPGHRKPLTSRTRPSFIAKKEIAKSAI